MSQPMPPGPCGRPPSARSAGRGYPGGALAAGTVAVALLLGVAGPAASAGGRPTRASAARRFAADLVVLDSTLARVRVALGVAACVAEAAGETGAEAAAHQLGTCRLTGRNPAYRPEMATNPGPARFGGPIAALDATSAALARGPWPSSVATTARTLRRSAGRLAAELGSTAPAGKALWSSGVEQTMGRVAAFARAVARRLGLPGSTAAGR